MTNSSLNAGALAICRAMLENADALRVEVHRASGGATVIDCGVHARGGLEAGRLLAEVCLAGGGHVQYFPAAAELWPGLSVAVTTDHPVRACMASQYAGWKIEAPKFFAMGSGPMRAAGQEAIVVQLGLHESTSAVVGVLETASLPPEEAVAQIAEACGVDRSGVTLLVARTASQAGSVQIAARSVETALHKLHELGFDIRRVESAYGSAPLPPAAGDDQTAIGRTNDAILYGGEVTLWVRGDDASLEAVGPRTPASASADYGRPFAEIFAHYGRDFYAIDPLLFSPAVVTLSNLDTGRSLRFGHTLPRVIHRSFGP